MITGDTVTTNDYIDLNVMAGERQPQPVSTGS
jgi:hypothetical protein